MWTLAQVAYLDSSFDTDSELPRAGCALENPYVFDESARELKAFAAQGLVAIVHEHVRSLGNQRLIDRLVFRRLR
jgi:hypothetical protein